MKDGTVIATTIRGIDAKLAALSGRLAFDEQWPPDLQGPGLRFSVFWFASRVLELAPAFWQQTLQQEDTQQRFAATHPRVRARWHLRRRPPAPRGLRRGCA